MTSHSITQPAQDVIKKDLSTAFQEICIGYGLLMCNKDEWSKDDYQWFIQELRGLIDITEEYQRIQSSQQA